MYVCNAFVYLCMCDVCVHRCMSCMRASYFCTFVMLFACVYVMCSFKVYMYVCVHACLYVSMYACDVCMCVCV